MQLKPLIRRIHLIVAIASCLPLMIVGATGTLLVFPEWLQNLTSPVALQVTPAGEHLSSTAIVEAMNASLPSGDQVIRLVYPESDGWAVTATTKKGWHVAANPYTGEVLSTSEDGGVYEIILRLHTRLLLGKYGTWVTGLSAISACLLWATGLPLWWPVGSWSRQYFSIAWTKPWKRINFDLHRATGFYLGPLLFLIALTGATIAFWQPAESLVYLLTWSNPSPEEPRKVEAPSDAAMISPDQAVAAAMAEVPGTKLYRLYVPADANKPYRVFLNPPESFRVRTDESRLVIDSYTGKVLFASTSQTRSRGDQAMMWVLPLHYGTPGGLPLRVVYLFVSASPLLLTVTGLVIWLLRRAKLKRAREFAERALREPKPAEQPIRPKPAIPLEEPMVTAGR